MPITSKNLIFICSAVIVLCCAGCGGGGGGGSTASPVAPIVPLTMSAEVPSLAGKTGEQVTLSIKADGSGKVTTASFNLHFNSGEFEPIATRSDLNPSIEVDGLPADTVCRYKWIDAQTIKIAYASAQGISAGNVIVGIPVKVLSESSPNVSIQQAVINNGN